MFIIKLLKYLYFFLFLLITSISYSKELVLDEKELNKIIKKYILENPDILLQSIENYRKNAEQENIKNIKLKLAKLYEEKIFDELPHIGNKKSELLLIEFIDYNCGYCKKTIKTINNLIKNIDNLKIVFIDFPILSDTSELAAKASLAANKQNSYFEYHSELLKYEGQINEEVLILIANKLKLNINNFKKDLISREIENQIKINIEIARSLNIRGTPTFLFKDFILAGAYEYEKLAEIIKNK